MEKKYSISDAAKRVHVEAHVLRYWEEELELKIPRTSQGHRFYRDNEIETLQKIKELKEQGFRLHAIKKLIPNLGELDRMDPPQLYQLRERLNQQEETHLSSPKTDAGEKMQKFQDILRGLIQETVEDAISKSMEESQGKMSEQVSTRVIKELNYIQRENQDLGQKQVELLGKILEELKPENTSREEEKYQGQILRRLRIPF